jgi:TM2 domain
MTTPSVQASVPTKSVGIAYVLWLFAGGLGAHKFYLRRPGLGFLYICFLVLFWTGVFSIGSDAVSLATGHHPSGRSALTSLVMMAPLSLALLYDLFTIPLQVRAVNNGLGSGTLGSFGSRSKSKFDDDDKPDGERLAKIDEAIARYKAQQTTVAPAVVARTPVMASGTPTFGKRR